MRTNMFMAAVGLALAGASGSACAMTKPAGHAIQCSVEGAGKLPAEIGGADRLCQIIREATQPAAAHRGQGAAIIVEIVGPSAAVARIELADGSVLTPARVDVSDRLLSVRSIEMLAQAAADQIRDGATKN